MGVFENMRRGQAYNIHDEDYQRKVHGEIDRARHLTFFINQTDPTDTTKINELEHQLLTNGLPEGSFLTHRFKSIVPAEFSWARTFLLTTD